MRPGPPSVAVASGALLGMAVATTTPGLLFVAGWIDPLHAQVITVGFHVVLAAWGAISGALVVRDRFKGESRRTLVVVPVYAAITMTTGMAYTFSLVLQGGRDAFGVLLLLGALTAAIAGASLVVAGVTWLLVRRLATGFIDDAARYAGAEAPMAKRAAWWLLGAAVVHIAGGVVGGPVVFGVVAAAGSAWLFLRARPVSRQALGTTLACLLGLAGAAVQTLWWGILRHDLARAAMPACADGESDPMVAGAYSHRAREVAGVAEVISLLRFDPSKAHEFAYHVNVIIRPAPGAAAPEVKRAVEDALAHLDCEERQLGRVPFVVLAPPDRPIDVEAIVVLRSGASLAALQPELDAKIRAGLSRTRIAAGSPALELPVAADLTGVEAITWRVDGAVYWSGARLPPLQAADAELPVLHGLVVTERPHDGGLP